MMQLKTKRDVQQVAQDERRYGIPLAYGDFHGRELVNPFWRYLMRNNEVSGYLTIYIHATSTVSHLFTFMYFIEILCYKIQNYTGTVILKLKQQWGLTEDAMPL